MVVAKDLKYYTKADFTEDQWHLRGVHLEQETYRALRKRDQARNTHAESQRHLRLSLLATLPIGIALIVLNPGLVVVIGTLLITVGIDFVALLREANTERSAISAAEAEIEAQFNYQLHFAADMLDTPHKTKEIEATPAPKAMLSGSETSSSALDTSKKDYKSAWQGERQRADNLYNKVSALQGQNKAQLKEIEYLNNRIKEMICIPKASMGHDYDTAGSYKKVKVNFLTEDGIIYTNIPIPKPDVEINDGFGKPIKGLYESAVNITCTECKIIWSATSDIRLREIMWNHREKTGSHANFELVRT